jgi:hypothetical protein
LHELDRIQYRSDTNHLLFSGRGEGSVVLSAARREAISPGSKVGLRSTVSIFIVGFDALVRALWILGELRNPMLRRRRSWERDTTEGELDGTSFHGQGVGGRRSGIVLGSLSSLFGVFNVGSRGGAVGI